MEQNNTAILKDKAPTYTRGEEILNVITHGAGVVLGAILIVVGINRSIAISAPWGIAASLIFGICMMFTYSISSVYHGLKPSKAKRVFRVLDHCAIYFLIIGSYIGILFAGVLSYSPTTTYILSAVELGVGALAITLTAVDMKKYGVFSMFCYIILGWCIMTVPHIITAAISIKGVMWLVCGGIAYTAGSILYGLGRKAKYIHGIFHIFCIIGSVFHFICFAVYCI